MQAEVSRVWLVLEAKGFCETQERKGVNLLRKHWYDLGGFFAAAILLGILVSPAAYTHYQRLLWLSLAALLLHQVEEYRIPGTFPGMVNKVIFRSQQPDRYPLNTNTAFVINVGIGWPGYLLAAVWSEKAVWLGLATMLVSLGNWVAHTIVFNAKGKTWYNAGMLTSLLFFGPCIYFFFLVIWREHLATPVDYFVGIALGIVLNVLGIFKMIAWLADKHTRYIFEKRNLLRQEREQSGQTSK